jgi:hypothetical protein
VVVVVVAVVVVVVLAVVAVVVLETRVAGTALEWTRQPRTHAAKGKRRRQSSQNNGSDRQAGRQTDRQAGRQASRQTDTSSLDIT